MKAASLLAALMSGGSLNLLRFRAPGVHRVADARRVPRPEYHPALRRNTRSKYMPHQGERERFRRSIGGFTGIGGNPRLIAGLAQMAKAGRGR